MKRTALIAASAAAAMLVLSSCGAAADPADQLNAAPASGETIEGDGYSYSVPEGWGVPEGVDGATQGLDTVAADLADTDGFADNVNVVLSPAGQVSVEQAEQAGADELTGGGATDVEVEDRVRVADTDAAHLSANFAQGTSYAIEQYYVSDDDQTFVVTFSFSDSVDDDERTEIAESVLASWTWG